MAFKPNYGIPLPDPAGLGQNGYQSYSHLSCGDRQRV
jgi:hypothetical protein